MISAEILADSKNELGNRITTLKVVMPRIILAEFNTHRMLSRNSASSRAIPFDKLIKAVQENPFIPIKWMANHKGMQGTEYLNEAECELVLKEWLQARTFTVNTVKSLSKLNLTKQIVNRLLEPFMWHTVIVTATEWENFFALRYDSAAEIHMQEVARVMLEAMNNSTPKELQAGKWHIPFGDKHPSGFTPYSIKGGILEMVKVSTARCAGVSYTIVGEDGKEESYEKLIARHDKLASSGHWSPFEHCAKSMSYNDIESYDSKSYHTEKYIKYDSGWCGNFRGFIQYRKLFKYENRSDKRLIKK